MRPALERGSPRPGFSAVEVLFAGVLVVVLIVPLMGLSQSRQREAYFLEFHVTATMRARALADWAVALGPAALESELAAKGAPAAAAPDGVMERAVPAGWLPARTAMVEFTGPTAGPPGKREELFASALYVAVEDATPLRSLHRVRAVVRYSLPGESGPPRHSQSQMRLVASPGASHTGVPR